MGSVPTFSLNRSRLFEWGVNQPALVVSSAIDKLLYVVEYVIVLKYMCVILESA